MVIIHIPYGPFFTVFPPVAVTGMPLPTTEKINAGIVMDQVFRELPAYRKITEAVEIVVHVSGSLEDGQRKRRVSALEQQGGIVSAEFCPLRCHLMLVRYDSHRFSSPDVLSAVAAQNLQARPGGPIWRCRRNNLCRRRPSGQRFCVLPDNAVSA
jgi:hypothetical protein